MILATAFPLEHVLTSYAYALSAPRVPIHHACGAAIGFPSSMFLLDSILKKKKPKVRNVFEKCKNVFWAFGKFGPRFFRFI